MTNRYRGEIAVPELGDGFSMRCDMEALARIETAINDFQLFQHKVNFGLTLCAPSILRLFLANAVWHEGKRVKATWPDDEPLETLRQYCRDAWAHLMRGKSYAELLAEDEAKEPANENPTQGMAA